MDDGTAEALAALAHRIAGAGGLVVIPENAALLDRAAFRGELLAEPEAAAPTLGYGQSAPGGGLHVMEAPTGHAVETLSGLGATGVEVMLAHLAVPPLQAHPMIPLLQVSAHGPTARRHGRDLDLVLEGGEAAERSGALLEQVLRVASRRYTPRLYGQGNTGFQLTRGWLGLSL